MDKPQDKLVKGSFYLMLDNATTVITGALFWIIIAKIIEPSILGQSMVVIAFTATIVGFIGYGMNVMVSKYIAEFNARNQKHYSRKVLIIGLRWSLAISGAVSLIILLFADNIANNLYNEPKITQLLILGAIGLIPSNTIQILLKGAFEGTQKMNYSLLINVIFQMSRLILAIVFVAYGLSSFGIISSFIIGSSAAVLLGYFYMIPKTIPKTIPKIKETYDLSYITRFSWFNYINSGMRTLSQQIGIIVLGSRDFEFAAFYGLASIISYIIESSSFAISRTMLPTASGEYAIGTKERVTSMFNSSMRIAIVLSGFMFVILFSYPSYILSLLSESYIQASSALQILSIAILLRAISSICISVINAANKANEVAKISMISHSIIIISTLVLSQNFGMNGVAFAMLLGMSILLTLSLHTLYKLNVTFKISTIKPILTVLTTLIISFILTQFLVNVVISIITTSILYIILALMYKATNKKEISYIVAVILNLKGELR